MENEQTLGNAFRSRCTKTYYIWNIQIIRVHYTIIVTDIHMDMVIVTYEFRRRGKCVYKMTLMIHIRINLTNGNADRRGI